MITPYYKLEKQEKLFLWNQMEEKDKFIKLNYYENGPKAKKLMAD